MSYLLPTVATKEAVDEQIMNCIDKVLVLRFGRATEAVCLQQDDILAKAVREVSKFATIALVDVDAEDIEVYVKYFDITFIPATIFFFNAQHMKMDSGVYNRKAMAEAAHQGEVSSAIRPRQMLHHDKPLIPLHRSGLSLQFNSVQKAALCWNLASNLDLTWDAITQHSTPDHTKWIGAFHSKQDFIDVVETIFRGAMKGKLIVTCPLPPERIPKFQLLYKEI